MFTLLRHFLFFPSFSPFFPFFLFFPFFFPFFPTRQDFTTKSSMNIAEATQGKYGLEVLASLVIAMQADGYVLTRSSNFSRLMNEIRVSIVNVQCGNCTEMVDLQFGVW